MNGVRNKITVNQSVTTRVCIQLWKLVSGAYLVFQVVNLFRGKQILADKMVAALFLALYMGGFIVGLEFERDSTPIQNINKLATEQGNGTNVVIRMLH